MIKFAICDDEPYMLEQVSSQIFKYMEATKKNCHINCFTSGYQLLQSDRDFNVLFLDIQMDELNGLETARQLREQGYSGLIVFITVLKDNVFDSFEVQAFDYLVKPLDLSHLERTMKRVIRYLDQETGKSIIIQKGSTCQIIMLAQIIYCEVLGRKVYVHQHGGGTIDYYEKLGALEKRMDSRFFKCHRSYLVNLDYVRGYQGGLVMLSGGEQIPVSRLREQEFTQALLVHMKERRY